MRCYVLAGAVLLLAGGAHAASFLADQTVRVLDLMPRDRPAAEQRYFGLVVYRDAKPSPYPEQRFRHERLTAVPVPFEADTPDDAVYTTLSQKAADRPDRRFDFIILLDRGLNWEQIIQVEQFAREKRIVLISTTDTVGSAPFVIKYTDSDAYYRSPAVTSFLGKGINMRVFGLKDRPDAPVCKIVEPDPQFKDDSPPMICQHNAIVYVEKYKADREKQKDAIRDLSIAQMHNPDEKNFSAAFEKSWGTAGYHPHYGMARALSNIGRCKTMEREFDLSNYKAILSRRRELQTECRQNALRNGTPLGWSVIQLARTDDGRWPDLLPPFQPPLHWAELSLLF